MVCSHRFEYPAKQRSNLQRLVIGNRHMMRAIDFSSQSYVGAFSPDAIIPKDAQRTRHVVP